MNYPKPVLRLSVLSLCLAAVFASANEYHFSGYSGYQYGLQWSDPTNWLESHVAGPGDSVVFNAIPYDSNYVSFQYQPATVGSMQFLDGAWNLGAFDHAIVNVQQDLIIGNSSNPETLAGYTSASLTIDATGATFGYLPYDPAIWGYMATGGNTYLGYGYGGSGNLTLIGSETNPLFETHDLYVGYHGSGEVDLQNSSVTYDEMLLGLFGTGTTSYVKANGAPSTVYTTSLTFLNGQPDNLYNAGLLTYSLGGNDASYFNPYAIAQTDVGGFGNAEIDLTKGATADFGWLYVGGGGVTLTGTGVVNLSGGSYALARLIDVSDGSSMNVTDSYVAVRYSPYSQFNLPGEGQTHIWGINNPSSLNLTNSTYEAQSAIEIGNLGTMNVTAGSQVFFTDTWRFSYPSNALPDKSIYVYADQGYAATLNVDASSVDVSQGRLGLGYQPYYWPSSPGQETVNVTNGGSINAGSLTAMSGTVNVTGTNSNLHVSGQADIGLQYGTTAAALNVLDGATAQFDTYLKAGDSGTISVTAPGHTDGAITVGQAALPTQAGHIQIGVGGISGGDGLYNGEVDITGGTWDPGYCPGITTINGDFDMTSGTILIDLGGPDAGTGYDQVNASGKIDITGGVIEFLPYGGWLPSGGETFDIFNGSSFYIGPGVVLEDYTGWAGSGFQFTFNPLTGQGSAQAVPEPSCIAVVGLGLLGSIARRRVRGSAPKNRS